MSAAVLEMSLAESIEEALNSMFYLAIDGEIELPAERPEPWITRQLSFLGPENGRFGIGAAASTVRLIASNFLGQDPEELSEDQAAEILGELANMVCGSVLGHSTSTKAFSLSTPCAAEEKPWDMLLSTHQSCRAYSLEGALLVAWLDLEAPSFEHGMFKE